MSQLGINSSLLDDSESIIDQLAQAGADFNLVYEDLDKKRKQDLKKADEETLCKGTILIN